MLSIGIIRMSFLALKVLTTTDDIKYRIIQVSLIGTSVLHVLLDKICYHPCCVEL